MKTKRIFSILLSIAMLTTFIPMTVSAATTPTITLDNGTAAPSNIYVDNLYRLKVSGLRSRDERNTCFISSDENIAKIRAATGDLKTLKPGTVTITAKVRASGKLKTVAKKHLLF